MSKIIIASLTKFANELDNMNLSKFANELDDVIERLAQTKSGDIQQQINEAEQSQQNLLQQTEEGEKRLKQDELTQGWRKTQGVQAIQQQIMQLREQLKKQKMGQETGEPLITPIEQTAPTGAMSYSPPTNYGTII